MLPFVVFRCGGPEGVKRFEHQAFLLQHLATNGERIPVMSSPEPCPSNGTNAFPDAEPASRNLPAPLSREPGGYSEGSVGFDHSAGASQLAGGTGTCGCHRCGRPIQVVNVFNFDPLTPWPLVDLQGHKIWARWEQRAWTRTVDRTAGPTTQRHRKRSGGAGMHGPCLKAGFSWPVMPSPSSAAAGGWGSPILRLSLWSTPGPA